MCNPLGTGHLPGGRLGKSLYTAAASGESSAEVGTGGAQSCRVSVSRSEMMAGSLVAGKGIKTSLQTEARASGDSVEVMVFRESRKRPWWASSTERPCICRRDGDVICGEVQPGCKSNRKWAQNVEKPQVSRSLSLLGTDNPTAFDEWSAGF